MTQIVDSKGGTTSSTYNGVDEQIATSVTGSGVASLSASMSYDSIGRMTEIDRYDDSTLSTEVSHSTFSYDGSSNMTGETDYVSGGGTIVYVYAYDGASRMTSEVRQDISSTVTTTYEYNRDSQFIAVFVNGTQTGSYIYDASSNLDNSGTTIATGNQINYDGTWYYTFDAAANVTEMSKGASADTWIFAYNLNNQVVSATEYSTATITATYLVQTIDYGYDVFGKMISRTVTPAGGSPTTTKFAYNLARAGRCTRHSTAAAPSPNTTCMPTARSSAAPAAGLMARPGSSSITRAR